MNTTHTHQVSDPESGPELQEFTGKNSPDYVIAALYKFVALPDYVSMKEPILEVAKQNKIVGSLLLAEEGVNGTIAGPEAGLNAMLDYLRSDPRLADLEPKYATYDERPFKRLKVRLKKEIVTIGVPGVNPNNQVGTYVKPEDWNDIIRDPNVVVIDTRNDYECAIGTFENAIDPQTKTFREFPEWVQNFKKDMGNQEKPKIAMFCTGGIRCEKASSYMLQEGFPEVYHLEGGILKYLETVPAAQSAWQGECFVFDERVAVGHDLEVGEYSNCMACGRPLSPEDLRFDDYEPGVSCRHCISETTEEQKARFRTREQQMAKAGRGSTQKTSEDSKQA